MFLLFFYLFFTDNNESCESLWNRVCVKEPDGLREEACQMAVNGKDGYRGGLSL